MRWNAAFVSECRRQAARGTIEVLLSPYLIEDWKPTKPSPHTFGQQTT